MSNGNGNGSSSQAGRTIGKTQAAGERAARSVGGGLGAGVREGEGNPFLSPPRSSSFASVSSSSSSSLAAAPTSSRSVTPRAMANTMTTPKKQVQDLDSRSWGGSPGRAAGGSGHRGGGPYGPIKPDSNHFDPFAMTSPSGRGKTLGFRPPGSPSRSTTGQAGTGASGTQGQPQAQGFIFAPSPSRLKSLLAGNSVARSPGGGPSASASSSSPLRASPRGGVLGVGITPRSKARKRLRGEEVDETPKGRKKGDRDGFKGWMSDGLGEGSEDAIGGSDDDDEDDEVLGPTPRKEGGVERRKAFKVLFEGEDDEEDDEEPGMALKAGGSVRRKKDGKQGGPAKAVDDGVGKMFKRRKIEDDPSRVNGTKDEPMMTPRKGTKRASGPSGGTTPLKGEKLAFLAQLEMQDEVDASHTSQDALELPELERSPEGDGRIRVEEDLVREIEWSDSDPDIDAPLDGDAGGMDVDTGLPKRRMTRVKIEPYRLDQQRRIAAAGGAIQARDLRSGGRQFERTISAQSAGEGRNGGSIPDDGEINGHLAADDHDHADDESQSLSRLTLRSPENDVLRKTMAYHERKAMAIFSSKAANDLRLRRKGIEIYAAGEGIDGDQDEDDVDAYGHEREVDAGDDDWDSEPDGWKGVGLGVDDDW